ncbi:MAG: DUF2971 domain-containing protein [Chloroflexota bacterium]
MANREEYIKRPNPSEKIWQYMDFIHFVSLIDKGCLFFRQAKKFSDPYEGSFTWLISQREYQLGDDSYKRMIVEVYNDARQRTAVTCWHINSEESAAMWDLYSNRRQGIAIQSTVERLHSSLAKSAPKGMKSGTVNYFTKGEKVLVKPGAAGFSGEDIWFYKRKSFEHEKEYRITIQASDRAKIEVEGGIYVAVDLKLLIEKIYIAPSAETWKCNLIHSVANKYGLSVPIRQSDLDKAELY